MLRSAPHLRRDAPRQPIRHTRAWPAYPSIVTRVLRRRWMAGSSPAMTI